MNRKRQIMIGFWSEILMLMSPVWTWAAVATVTESMGMTHRMMMLAIQLGLILFAAKIGNILFEKIKMPGVLGELVVGIVIGPYVFGGISFYGFEQGLFPMYGDFAISPELYGMGAVAAIVLLFTVGLETDLGLLIRYSLVGTLVGMGGVVVSFMFGAGVMVLYSESLIGHPTEIYDPIVLFAGIVSTATSVGITARILSEKHKLDSPEGVTIMSAAVIDDVVGIVLLAVVMGVVSASERMRDFQWANIGLIAFKAIGVWLTATLIGLAASRKISILLKWFGRRTSIAIMALGLGLILAGLFEEFGLAMIIGAYVMGLTLSQTDLKHVIREKMDGIYEFLVPVFFCTTGMQINPAAVWSPGVLSFASVFSIFALTAKVIGCGLPAMLTEFNWRGSARVGMGMVPRGEVGLIIAGIGLSSGLLNQELFAAFVFMVVINTLVAPPALMFLFRSPESGLRESKRNQEKGGMKLTFDFPSYEMTDFFMDKLSEVFESEGFYVHTLSHDKMIHQVRKDTTVIDFQCQGTTLEFNLKEVDVPLINTAMLESLAALEQTIHALKKPMDILPISTRFLEQTPVSYNNITLDKYLTPSLIVPKLKGETRAQIIDELLDVLVHNKQLIDIHHAREAVWERERSMPTGLQYGIAIPHGKTDAVDRLVCAVGVKCSGVDFEAMDGELSTIIFLTLSPATKPAPHVQFMALISQVLNSHGRDRLLACKTAKEMYQVLTSCDVSVEQRKKIAEPKKQEIFELDQYLKPEMIVPRLRGDTKEEVIDELLRTLEQTGLVRDRQKAKEAVLRREDQMPTGMTEGIAIPHGRTDAVDNLVCAIGVKPEGMDFGSRDGEPSKIIVMALATEKGTTPYLQFTASIMRALTGDRRKKILHAHNREDIYKILIDAQKNSSITFDPTSVIKKNQYRPKF
ncbi:MAG: PTS transporter subunit EIIA [Phycisphaerae bacterium]|nr:PTS transporter subunit EIIA [Phycisphaerae bacterium]